MQGTSVDRDCESNRGSGREPVQFRRAGASGKHFAEIAAEFVRLNVNVIVTAGGAVFAAKEATSVARTNWHYKCANAFIDGQTAALFGQAAASKHSVWGGSFFSLRTGFSVPNKPAFRVCPKPLPHIASSLWLEIRGLEQLRAAFEVLRDEIGKELRRLGVCFNAKRGKLPLSV